MGLLFLGTLFHLSLMVAWPLIFFSGKKYFWWQYLLFGFFSVYGLYFLLSSLGIVELNQAILEYYLTTTRGSFAGAATRVFMNALPVFVSLFFWRRIKRISPDYTVIKCMAIAALLCILLVSVAPTLVDRIAVYLMPLQVALWPRLIAVQSTNIMRSVWALMIIIYYGLVLFVWFNYAVHAHLWLPYRMWPFTNEPLYPTFL